MGSKSLLKVVHWLFFFFFLFYFFKLQLNAQEPSLTVIKLPKQYHHNASWPVQI